MIHGFLKLAGGAFHKIAVPGAASTIAFGVNDNDTVVGVYTDGPGSTGTPHGFIWRIGGSLTTKVDDPNGIGTTTLNGINNEGDIVGFYGDSTAHRTASSPSPPSNQVPGPSDVARRGVTLLGIKEAFPA